MMVETQDLKDIVDNIYRCIFGILILLAEFRFAFLLQWFSFLTFFSGLGAFYVFVGGLALGSAWYEIALAIVMCSIGVLYLVSACACSEYAHQYQEEASLKASTAASSSRDIESAGDHPSSSPYRELEDSQSRKKMIENPFDSSDHHSNYSDPFAHSSTRSAYG